MPSPGLPILDVPSGIFRPCRGFSPLGQASLNATPLSDFGADGVALFRRFVPVMRWPGLVTPPVRIVVLSSAIVISSPSSCFQSDGADRRLSSRYSAFQPEAQFPYPETFGFSPSTGLLPIFRVNTSSPSSLVSKCPFPSSH